MDASVGPDRYGLCVKLTLAVEADTAEAAAEIRDLFRRLRDDPAARADSTVALVPGPTDPDSMGTTLDIVEFVVGTGFQAAALALALADWRRRRPERRTVVIELDSGVKVRMDDDPDAVARVVRALEEG